MRKQGHDGLWRRSRLVLSHTGNHIQPDIIDSAVRRRARDAERRDEYGVCAFGRKCARSQHKRHSTSVCGRGFKARSDRQYLHNDSTAAVHCGARALRDAPHRCGRRVGPIVARPTCTFRFPRCIDASFTVWSRNVFRGPEHVLALVKNRQICRSSRIPTLLL